MKQLIDHPGYFVGSHGTIFSAKGKELRILKPQKCGNGYLSVSFSDKGIVTQRMVHRVVALTFIPNPKNKPEVNHKDGDKLNNRAKNLEWATSKENTDHALKMDFKKNKTGAWKDKNGYNHNKSKEVIVTNSKGKEIKKYGSLRNAAKSTKIPYSTLQKCISIGGLINNRYYSYGE